MPIALLLSMQAAGMVVDYLGTKDQARLGKMGLQLQNAGIESNIQQTRLETEDASLEALKTLRQNLGSQIALFAARGTATNAGSALSIMNSSIANSNSDERMRRMNLMGRENALRSGATLAKLNQSGENTKLWTSFASRTANTFSSNPNFYLKKDNPFSGSKAGGFGLTQVR